MAEKFIGELSAVMPAAEDLVEVEDDPSGTPASGRASLDAIATLFAGLAGKIAALTEKVSPVSGDWLVIEDSAASNAKKKVQVGNLPSSSVTKATAANIRAGTADTYVTSDGIESAAEEVTLTDAATIAVDWSTFINGNVTLAGNRTLGAPSNGEPGTSRFVRVIQDGTGSRTLAFASEYKHPGGTAPTLTTTAAAVDVLEIYCVSTNVFYVFSALDMF